MIEELKKYLKFRNGFFVEAGAYDGISFSNTLYLEKKLNWKGILIEPTFENYLSCIKKRKNSIVINSLLTSFENYTKKKYAFGDFLLSKTEHAGGGAMSSINNIKFDSSLIFNLKNLYSKIRAKSPIIPIHTTPLSLIADFYNISNIDFFSLDVEGHEYDVLKGINFKKLYIKYICVEARDFNKNQIFDLLKKNNFKLIQKLTNFSKKKNPNWSGHQDYLFKNKNMFFIKLK